MRWAKLANEVGNRFPNDANEFIKCKGNNHKEGREDLEKILKKENKKPLGEWETHRFHKAFSLAERERYELFVGGFLFFYDEENRNNAVNHIIYFEWSDVADLDGRFSVTIYISPAPEPNLLNGIPAAGTKDPPAPPPPPPPPMS